MRVQLSPSAQNLMVKDWKNFIETTKNRKPTKLLTESLETLHIDKGFALDIGCGAGVDTKYLAEHGFTVEAIDSSEESIAQTKKLCKNLNVKVIHKNISEFEIVPKKYSLIFSWNALPYLKKTEAENVLRKSYTGLKKNGVFIASIFGPEDDWAKDKSASSFFTIDEIKNIFKGAKFISMQELKETKPTATGITKFWHLIKFVIKK